MKLHRHAFFVAGLLVGSSGCQHYGPGSIVADRIPYNTAIATSWQEQTLLNIVKLRYVDAPTFIDIGSIVSSYTLSETATATGTIVPGGTGSSAGVGIGGAFSNSPTITYTPLTGASSSRDC